MLFSNKVSVVVCCKNAEETIDKCLVSILLNDPFELIVVDGGSTDRTVEISKKYTNNIFSDPGKGLGVARNIGLDKASGEHVFFVGPDNVLPPNSINSIGEKYLNSNFIGVAPLTVLLDTKGYIKGALNFYKRAKIKPGESTVIGTPWLYPTEVLRKFRYDDKMKFSDDTDLCYRLIEAGYKVGFLDIDVYEIGNEDISSVFTRWKMYGTSDFDFFQKYKSNWSMIRKIKSFAHPFQSDFINIVTSKRLKLVERIYIFPYVLLLTYSRYIGWYKAWRNDG